MPDENLIKLIHKTYLRMLENSIGSRIFNSNFVKNKETGEEFDILDDGVYAGAFFVSGILMLFGQIDKPHSTVKTILDKFGENDSWAEIPKEELKAGDVIVWEVVCFDDGTESDQIGFALDEDHAVSTSYKERKIIKHDNTFGQTEGMPVRKIERVFRNKFL